MKGLRIVCHGCGATLYARGPEPDRAAKTVGTCCAGAYGLTQAQAYRPPEAR